MTSKILSRLTGVFCLAIGVPWVGLNSAQAIHFTPPEANSAPSQRMGGISRGAFNFVPPADNRSPSQTTGGSSRDGFSFIPPAEQGTPSQTTGGSSRDGFSFIPPAEHGTPSQTTGGSSRDGFSFIPPAEHGTPSQTTGGSSRAPVIPHADNTSPQGTQGGASRTKDYVMSEFLLGETSPSIMAITPPSFYGTTLSERPAFLAYIPPSLRTQVIFSLKDDQGNLLYQQPVPLSNEGGIVFIELPENAPILEVNHYYQWLLTIQIEDVLTPASPFVDAWIKRISPSTALTAQLETNDPISAATVLAQNGVWYDTVATLAEVHGHPATSTLSTLEDWEELLTSVELEDVMQANILLPNAD